MLFLQKGLNANLAAFTSKMPSEVRGASKAATAAPITAIVQVAFTYPLLLAAIKLFVAFVIVFPIKRLPTHGANERSLVRVSAKIISQVKGSSESF